MDDVVDTFDGLGIDLLLLPPCHTVAENLFIESGMIAWYIVRVLPNTNLLADLHTLGDSVPQLLVYLVYLCAIPCQRVVRPCFGRQFARGEWHADGAQYLVKQGGGDLLPAV